MDFAKLTDKELQDIILKHHEMVCANSTSILQENLDEAWNAVFEISKRSRVTMDAQSERIAALEDNMEDLIITDVTYRGAYKFIYEKGLEREFEIFLLRSTEEVLSNVIPFPTSH
jgi:hypothetical protein